MHKGQALVMVMLIMAVAATIGLSIASRSTSQLSVSTTQDESARAREAAEIGVEQALGGLVATGVPKTINIDPITNNYTTYNGVSNKKQFEWPYLLINGDAANVPLNGYNLNMRVCWGNGSGITPAIEITGFYEIGGAMNSNTITFDPLASRRVNNNFAAANNGCPSISGYSYNTGMLQMVGGAGALMPGATKTAYLRIRMLYNSVPQNLALDGQTNNLPVIANDIISTGQAGSATQKVHVTNMEPDYQDMFGAAVFSGTGITKHICPVCP